MVYKGTELYLSALLITQPLKPSLWMGNVEHMTVWAQNRIWRTEFLNSLHSVTRSILFSATLQAYCHISTCLSFISRAILGHKSYFFLRAPIDTKNVEPKFHGCGTSI